MFDISGVSLGLGDDLTARLHLNFTEASYTTAKPRIDSLLPLETSDLLLQP
jgi:hypothetical protein